VRNGIRRDLGNSARAFLDVVVPAIRPLIGDGRIEPVENSADEGLKHDLDVLAGIDGWQLQDREGRMRGIASRIQWGDSSWQTFTIRRERENGNKTEWEKRLRAFLHPEAGWLLPALTVQAYLTLPKPGGKLIDVAVIRTADLYDYAIRSPCRNPRWNYTDGPGRAVQLDWYRWADLRRDGIQVGIVASPDVRSFLEQATLFSEADLSAYRGDGTA
jgi:hypothetical protein